MEKNKLSIGSVAKAAGMSSSALRFYEGAGLLPDAERINGRRIYDDRIFAYLAAIRLAQESGFSVSEMRQLLESCDSPGNDGRWKDLALAKIEELDRTIARANAMKSLLHQWLDCECVSLEDCRLIADRLATGGEQPAGLDEPNGRQAAR